MNCQYAGPAEIKVTLKNGRSLKIRPGGPTDHRRLKDFFERLGPMSRYLRFGCQKSSFRDDELALLLDCSPPDCFVMVATRGEGEEERIVALANWGLLADGKMAEVSFVVEEAIQLRGVGTALLGVLAGEAARWGVKTFLAYVLPQNAKMMEVFENSGFGVKKIFCEDNFEIRIFIDDDTGFRAAEARRHRTSCQSLVRRFLHPQQIVLLVDDAYARSFAPYLKKNIAASGFSGSLSVAQVSAAVGVDRIYPSWEEIPGLFDLAILGLNRDMMPGAIAAGLKRGVAFFMATDFKGGKRKDLPKKEIDLLAARALAYGARFLGPGSGGVINNNPLELLNATLAEAPAPGRISVAYSDEIRGRDLINALRRAKVGVNHVVGLGQAADVCLQDWLEFWEDDEGTEAVLLLANDPPPPPVWPPPYLRSGIKKKLIVMPPAALLLERAASPAVMPPPVEVQEKWRQNLAAKEVCFLTSLRELEGMPGSFAIK